MWTTEFVPGTPDWTDLGTPDPAASAAFYTGLLGWTDVSAGPESGGYGFFQLQGKTVAGYGPLTEPGAKPSWTVYWQLYFEAADCDVAVAEAVRLGGSVVAPAQTVPTVGRMAVLADPHGVGFSVITSER